ncbi:MAG: aldose 1-epimerase family protein [Erysipelotrichaceae bacterium]|uniref:aldose 1-epimerase family protein n=1 Tax=Floccifex sp. TaxID=2815810 RepID=UPI002A75037B|nr:aldose 1-epimerase family protein [Floccifex sp.]MDD7281440.1 aldose 1-epimerase family protein [Erysipelotrichaceae bacterium]MDY2958397.1 aldose 1-epimerase family protein [Floccifex sp.]
MSFILENEFVRLECSEKGGEIQSFYDLEKNKELMYQGNQGWSGKNPTLFPIIGNTATKEYTIHGEKYAMKNHGLIRYATLNGQQNKDSIVFILDANEETLKQYPFSFHYEIKYSLVGRQLKIEYHIQNTSQEDMPYTFGLHPAFIVPQNNNEKFEDYSIDFEVKEQAKQLLFDPSFEKKVEYKDVSFDTWKCSRDDIKKYATIIYKDLKSKYVTLSCKGEPRVRMSIDGFPYLALWTIDVPSDFICIEPWFGHADFEYGHDDFYTREGTMILKPQEVFETSYTIEAL